MGIDQIKDIPGILFNPSQVEKEKKYTIPEDDYKLLLNIKSHVYHVYKEYFKKDLGLGHFPVIKSSSIKKPSENPKLKFERLFNSWKKDTIFISSISEKCMHPDYQQIIGMGITALPFIFEKLSEKPEHLFWALRFITGEDPILPENRGKLPEMTKDWLSWAKSKGYEC